MMDLAVLHPWLDLMSERSFQPKWSCGPVPVEDGPLFEAAELNILKKCSKWKTHHISNRKQTSMLQLLAHRISHGYVEINFRCENVGAGHGLRVEPTVQVCGMRMRCIVSLVPLH